MSWRWSRDQYHATDPRQFVLDEVAGQWLALLFVPVTGPVGAYVTAGFFLFRGFDIAKPWPIKPVEQLPGKWGTLLDDLVAGLFAAGGVWVLMWAEQFARSGR